MAANARCCQPVPESHSAQPVLQSGVHLGPWGPVQTAAGLPLAQKRGSGPAGPAGGQNGQSAQMASGSPGLRDYDELQ